MELSYNEKIIKVVGSLMKQLSVPFTASSLQNDLETHPDFPSLYAITGVLRERNIDSAAVQLSADQLLTLDAPMLLFPDGDQQEPALLSRLGDGNVSQQYADGQLSIISFDTFKATWSGVAVLADTTEASGEIDYAEHLKKERDNQYFQYGLGGLTTLLLISLLAGISDIRLALVLTSFLVGLILCCMLAMSSIQANSVITRLCRAGKNTDCNSVLNSPAATLFGWLKVADAGLIYFATGLTVLLFLIATKQNTVQYMALFAVISLLSLPYTIFSIVYQYRVVRQWCPLCLGVQGVLWVNFFLLASNLNVGNLILDFTITGIIAWFFGLSLALWLVIRKLMTTSAKAGPLRTQLDKLRRDTNVFNALLDYQPVVLFKDTDNDLSVGSVNAPIQLTVVTDPHCAPCKSTHQFLETVQSQHSDTVRLSCILHTRHKSLQDERNQIAILILSLPAEKRHEGLAYWFANRDLSKWRERFGTANQQAGQYIFANHNSWCAFAGVNYTPTIYVNSKRLPDFYTLYNLAYHIGAMREELV